MTKPLLQRIGIAIIAAFIVVWLYPHLKSHQFIYEEGRPWNYAQLIAPFDIPIHPDSATLRIARDTLDARFVPIYTLDAHVVDTIIGLLPDPGSDYNRRAARILRRGYERGVVDLPKIRAGELPRIRILEKNVLSEMSAANLTSPRDIYLLIDSTTTDPGLRAYFMAANVHGLLRANIVYDSIETARHYDNEYQTMTADRGVIVQGQAIINKGDIISAQDFTNLKTYESMMEDRVTSDSQSNLLMFLGQLFYAALLLALVMIYLHIFTPRVYGSLRSFTFIIALMVLFFVISVGLTAFIPGGIYIVPLTVLPILVLAFFDGRTAIAVSMATVLLIAPITSFALEFIFLQMCATSAAVFSLQELSRRSQLLRASAVVAVTYIVAYLALELLMNGTFEGFTWRMPAFLLTNALLTSTAYILMFAAERVFGFVSVVTLGELADINQPLLRELSDKCPGTFQHSMSVSNLVTDAARAMGADVQLVRAGALYHDIGKMTNPAFFTENQHGVNPHDTLDPLQSARIVIGHVSEGLKIAEKYKLPVELRRFISEHHGRGKTRYFYNTWCNRHTGEEPDEAAFSYPGPNPRSRETSIMMMADAVEAASRSMTDHSEEAIAALVNRIIDNQISEGLHNDSPISFRDVKTVKESFIQRLRTMYHSRIKYPDLKKSAGASKESSE